MGRLSKAVFARASLPSRCIVYGGVYVAGRKDVVRRNFHEWRRVKGSWIRYAYAKSHGIEYLVVFNVYGGALALEVLHLLNDGGVRSVFFIGSMYAKHLPIGALLIPTVAVDRAGLVLVDNPDKAVTRLGHSRIGAIELALKADNLSYEKVKIVSVPCVLHDIRHVKRFVAKSEDIAGVEMEVSTLHHFSKKIGLEAYVLLYVSDNQKHGIISAAKDVWKARREALQATTRVALTVLGSKPK